MGTGSEGSAEVMTHFTSGMVIVYALEYLKAAGWFPWLKADNVTLARWISAISALVVGFGITGHYDPMSGGTIHLPPLADLITDGSDAIKQFVTNQFIYDAVHPKPATVIVEHQVPSSLPAAASQG